MTLLSGGSSRTRRSVLAIAVKDATTGRPVAGISVSLGGHTGGVPGNYSATTDAAGKYRISGIFTGTYPELVAQGAGMTRSRSRR